MRYGFNVYQMKVEDHVFWIAESKDLKGCVGQGDTIDEAIAELGQNEIEWLETAEELGIKIPTPTLEENVEYSGKFMVRVSPTVHREASENAKKQGISLNQYINNAIVTMNVANVTKEAIKDIVNEVRDLVFISTTSCSDKTNSNGIVLQYPEKDDSNIKFFTAKEC